MGRSYAFNWVDYDRTTLFNILYSAYDKVVNKPILTAKLHDTLTRHIKQHLPVKFARAYSTKVDPGWIWIGGAYYSYLDQERRKSIEINFSYHSKDQHITLTGYRFTRMCMVFADTVLHEIIHMRQFRKRKFKVLPDYNSTAKREKQRKEQEYLGNNDEIDAYAFNIACEMLDKTKGSYSKVPKLLNENHKDIRRKMTCWTSYLKAFNHDHNHPIIKHLKKRVMYYLPQAERGRPFRSYEWIDS